MKVECVVIRNFKQVLRSTSADYPASQDSRLMCA